MNTTELPSANLKEARPATAPAPVVASPQRPAPGRTLRKRRSPWPTRIVVALVLVGGGVLAATRMKREPTPVETAAVQRGVVIDEVSSSSAGEVKVEQRATVRAELSARVLAVKHRRGERVKKGEVIVALDAAELDARLRQAQATVEVQRAQVAQAAAHAEAAQRTAERLRRLADHGAETGKAADDAEAQAVEAKAAAQAGAAQLEQAQAALQVARVSRSSAEITAPFAGVVAELNVDVGDHTQMGASVFELVDDSRLHVEATLDEADIGRVELGQSATLRLDALPERPIQGKVSKLDPTVRKDEKGARTLRIEVEVTDLAAARAAGVRPGMSANVDVRVAQKDGVLSLPTSVIVGRGVKRSVYRVEGGLAREQQVEVGLSSWERTEIVSGLKEGDRVIASLNVKGLGDGLPVVPAKGGGR
jgi:HlyD family secretion protein